MITNNSKGEINMKKLICLLVICANLVGVAVNVSAYSDYDTEETRFLRIMDIMNGYEDGTFKPYNVLTRSESIWKNTDIVFIRIMKKFIFCIWEGS